jgi:hypothetical protein
MKTAKALGVTIPQSIPVRADIDPRAQQGAMPETVAEGNGEVSHEVLGHRAVQ